MSKGPWNFRACCKPLIPSSDIQADGLLSTNDLLGSARLNIKPLFPINRQQLTKGIDDGLFPPPLRITTGALIWEARTLRDFVARLEAEQVVRDAAKSLPEGWATTADLVKLLGVSRQMIHKLYSSGRISRPQRFGGKPAWSPAQVDEIISSRREQRGRVRRAVEAHVDQGGPCAACDSVSTGIGVFKAAEEGDVTVLPLCRAHQLSGVQL